MSNEDHRRRSGSQNTPNSSSYLTWFLSRPHLFGRRSDATSLTPGTVVTLTAVADGTERQFVMQKVKIDGTLGKSVIARQKADASMATKEALARPEILRDSSGRIHNTTHCVTLRCAINDANQTVSERFYVSDNCGEFEALLRKEINQG